MQSTTQTGAVGSEIQCSNRARSKHSIKHAMQKIEIYLLPEDSITPAKTSQIRLKTPFSSVEHVTPCTANSIVNVIPLLLTYVADFNIPYWQHSVQSNN